MLQLRAGRMQGGQLQLSDQLSRPLLGYPNSERDTGGLLGLSLHCLEIWCACQIALAGLAVDFKILPKHATKKEVQASCSETP